MIKGVFKIQIYHKYIRGGPDLPGKGQKCYSQNRKVRKRECAIRPASYTIKAAGPAISVLRFTITGMNAGSLMSIMCSEDQTGRTPRNI